MLKISLHTVMQTEGKMQTTLRDRGIMQTEGKMQTAEQRLFNRMMLLFPSLRPNHKQRNWSII